ncbi:hypothetical protein AAEH85_22240, partial [Shewanella algae]|uniref:hypothetical protein n=1 Tax=Shewanella algae TaxID=38313 RepID=UPI00313CA7FE
KTLNEVLEPVTNSVIPEASEEIPIQEAPVIQNTPPKPIQPPVEKSIAMKMPEVDLEMLNELAEGDNEYKATIINMFLEGMPE